tara:strand:- start:209 stop:436 length:228 start_codon:yes stop_codon:yes gene_type:complete
MIINIPFKDLTKEAKEAIANKSLGNLSIDYADNGIFGWKEDKEITVYKFTEFKIDNRTHGYEIYGKEYGVTIEIT